MNRSRLIDVKQIFGELTSVVTLGELCTFLIKFENKSLRAIQATKTDRDADNTQLFQRKENGEGDYWQYCAC